MKKFLPLVLGLSTLFCFAENSLKPTVLFEVQDDDDVVGYALNKDIQLQHMLVNRQGNKTTVSILNLNSFTVQKSFTVPFDWDDVVALGVDDGELWLTQNMFNNDDKWEFIVWQNDGENQAVYNEDGVCLGVIANYTLEYVVRNGTAACFAGYVLDSDDSEFAFLQFNGNGAGVKSISLQQQGSVAYPNPVKQNSKFTVEFSSPLNMDGKLKIYDTSGRKVYRKNVKAGDSSVSIPSVTLRKGLYFYVVEKGGNILLSDKLIVD